MKLALTLRGIGSQAVGIARKAAAVERQIVHAVEEITVASTLQEMFRHIEAIGADTVVRGTKEIGSVLIERMTIAGQ